MTEAIERFECFGSTCAVRVIGAGRYGSAARAAALAREELYGWHGRCSRFLPGSELSRINRDPRAELPLSPIMALLAHAVRTAGALSGGLVDGTQVQEIERAGYERDLGEPVPPAQALALAPARAPARPDPRARWRLLEVDLTSCLLRRPPGVGLDSGGLAKGLFADVLAARLADCASFAIDCGGDLAIGGAQAIARPIEVQSPFDGQILHTFEAARTGVATSGIARRSWIDDDGRPAHHLLDPCSGRPAFTGIVQVTALAPSALQAEIRAKAAILAGPRAARAWLPHGGLIVLDDGSPEVVEIPPTVSLSELSAYA
jgi:thiamine biosynthesis lipoprotein